MIKILNKNLPINIDNSINRRHMFRPRDGVNFISSYHLSVLSHIPSLHVAKHVNICFKIVSPQDT